jgi:outer membrane protein assembly factor BamE
MLHPLRRLTPSLRPLGVAALCLASLGMYGCSTVDDQGPLRWLAPYRMEVVQGNVVTTEMLQQLREGQSREQVRMLLGSPLLTDLFHADRWDYVFSIRRQGAQPQQRRLTVFFSGDRVQRFQSGDLPDEKTFVASIEVDAPRARRTPLELDEEGLRALPLPTARAATSADGAASAPAGARPQRNYPPLETGSNTP